MQIKCGGANVPEVATSELPYRIGTKIILNIWLGRYRSRVEFGKSGVPPISYIAPP